MLDRTAFSLHIDSFDCQKNSKKCCQIVAQNTIFVAQDVRLAWRESFCYKLLHLATFTNIRQQNMSSNFRLEKTCHFCGVKYIAKTTVTQFCSDNCAKRAYKVRLREKKVQDAIKEENSIRSYNSVVSQKEFLSIKETAQLMGASRWTVYRLIENGKLKVAKLQRRTIIRRSEIDNLFK